MIVIIWERVFPPVVVWPLMRQIPSRILVNVCYANPISIRYMHVLNSKICHMNTRLLLWKLTTCAWTLITLWSIARCQKPHHTLLHVANTDASINVNSTPATILPPRISDPATINIAAPPFVPQSMESLNLSQCEPPSDVVTGTAIKLRSNTLLMTCRLVVCPPDGTRVEARALLDNGSSASFVSERLAQTLRLP